MRMADGKTVSQCRGNLLEVVHVRGHDDRKLRPRSHPFERVGVAPPRRLRRVGHGEQRGERVSRRLFNLIEDEPPALSPHASPRTNRRTLAPLEAVLPARHPGAGDLSARQILGADESLGRSLAHAEVQRRVGLARTRWTVQHNARQSCGQHVVDVTPTRWFRIIL